MFAVNLAWSRDQLTSKRSVLSRLKGSQPIFISQQRSPSGQQWVFANNARLVLRNVRKASTEDGEPQMLHIIDEVLSPTIPTVSGSSYFNPSANDYLKNSNKYVDGKFSLMKFYAKLREHNRMSLFESPGFHTFFIPIDTFFEPVRRMVDGPVIESHVIPDQVLFTRTIGNQSYHSATYSDNLKVSTRIHASWVPNSDSKIQYAVESDTIKGDVQHPPGTVLTKIVYPNIAVKNGVIHLIQKPLMVTNSDVFSIIKENHEDRAHEFFNLMKIYAPFSNMVMSAEVATVFIPSNEAFRDIPEEKRNQMKTDMKFLENLLKLHVVRKRISTDDVVKSSSNKEVFSVPSEDSSRPLYLSVSGHHDGDLPQTLYVDGGGTNATVQIADVTATNGLVHFIDKVLGIPYRSVGEKIAMNSMTSLSNKLAEQDTFSNKVGDLEKNFTLLVPSNEAWLKIKKSSPSIYKTLFSARAKLQASDILDRHLIIGNTLSMEQLHDLSKKEKGVKTFRSRFMIEKSSGNEYMVHWEQHKARVVRANLECTNGYVHIIDTVMMRKGDVTASSATYSPMLSWWLAGAAIYLLSIQHL